MKIRWKDYDAGRTYDELFTASGRARPHARALASHLSHLGPKQLMIRQHAAEMAIVEMGITFTVYSEGQNIDRAWPFDIIPRTISAREWQRVEQGLTQPLTAMNM